MYQRLCFMLLWLPLWCGAEEANKAAVPLNPGLPENSLLGGLSSWFFSTMAIVLLIVALGYLLKKSRLAINKRSGDLYLEQQIAVGPKERLLIVNVRGRSIVIGVTAHNISYICELSSDNAAAGFAQEYQKSKAQFKDLISKQEEPDESGAQHD